MEVTTVNSMNFLAMEDDDRIGARLPGKMKETLLEVSKKQGMNYSSYVKLAIVEKFQREEK